MLTISAFLIGLSGAMMPGPLLTYVINGSLQKGTIAGPLIMIGHSLLELLLIILLLSGLSNLFASDLFTSIIGITGGTVLFLMAINMIISVKNKEISFEKEIEKDTKINNKFSGFILPGALISISNPYWIIWWATIGITYLAGAQQQGMIGISAFFLGHITADFAWYTLVAFIISQGRKLLTDKLYRILIVLFALILILFGGNFLLEGVSYFI